MTRRTVLALATGLAASAVTGCGSGVRRSVRLAAGEDGGGYLEFARSLTSAASQGRELAIEHVVTAGSEENLELLAGGAVDLALTQQDTAMTFLSDSSAALSAVARIYDNYLQVAVPVDSLIRTIDDLRSRRVSLGRDGSGAFVALPDVFAAAGIDTGRDLDVIPLSLRDATVALRSGSLDAVGWMGAVPTPAATEAGAVRLIDLALLVGPILAAMRAPFRALTVPAGAYEDSPEVSTIGVPNLLLTRADLAEPTAADLVGLLMSSAGKLVPGGARGAQNLEARRMIDTGGLDLHPGAASRYRAEHR